MIKIGGYLMDVAISEEIVFPGDATKFPTETGSEFSDHIRDLPPEITLECIVSDSPIGDVATDPSRQRGTDDLGNELPLPSADALARLREMKARRRPVPVETSIGVFEQMAITEITVPVDKGRSPGTKTRAGALFFTAKLQRINVVTNRRTKVRVKTTLAGAGGGGKSKVVVGATVDVVSDIVIWRHANPPGGPLSTVQLISKVEVVRNNKQGMTRDETAAFTRTTPESPLIQYFDLGSATPITGQRRNDLVADLGRDLALAEQDKLNRRKKLIEGFENDRRAPLVDRNLPSGLSLERFQRPAPPTFEPPADAGDLSRFQRRLPSTFPG